MDEADPPGGPGRPAGRGRVHRRRGPDDLPIEEMAEALKERVYATFTGLAIVLVQHENADHISAGRATLTLLVGIVAISAAGFVADVISHLVVHADFPRGRELRRMLRVAGSALGSASIPLILLVFAVLGVFELQGALTAASIVYIATLALIGYVAVRRSRLSWWEQAVGLGMLVLLGLAVVGLQQLAHGH